MRFFYEFYRVRQRFYKKNVFILLYHLTVNYYKMKTNFTEDLLVKYIYGEVSLSEKHLVEETLDNNWELQELHEAMTKSRQELPKVKFSPRKSIIEDILKYSSEQTALEPHF